MKYATLIAALTVVSVGMTAVMVEARGNDRARGMQHEMPTFGELDANSDGEITLEDAEALRTARFAEVDADGDGSVSKAEFIAHAQARVAEQAEASFDRLDADGDGVLSADVLAARGPGPDRLGRMIERADADGSGGVSEEEFATAMERFAERGPRGGEREGRGGRN